MNTGDSGNAEGRIEDTLRHTAHGSVRGRRAPNGALTWRGIPYAAKPVGPLRWKAPRPVEAWQGERLAVKDGAACVQGLSLAYPFTDDDGDGLIGAEDCLYLNVFAPGGVAPEAGMPVMFFIHGGGNVGGHNAAPTYDGSQLAQRHNVVVVTLNYRLGLLGWFLHPALAQLADTAADRSGNWGTLDLIAGLEWVRDNIAAFGGDASNVTIFGESAGGVNVYSLLVSPRAAGLFQRAIVQSGGLLCDSLASACNYSDAEVPGSPASSREIVNQLLIRQGRAADRAAAKLIQDTMHPSAIAELLRSSSAAELIAIVNPSQARLYAAPRVLADGEILPAQPWLELFAAGRFNRVPLIVGTNRDERRFYQFLDPKWRKVLRERPGDYVRFAHYGSLAWKQRSVDDVARALLQGGQREVYAYRFDWDEQGVVGAMDLSLAVGAGHAVELPFVFGNSSAGLLPLGDKDAPGRRELSASMMSYWTQHAYHGAPGRGRDGREAAWTAWSSEPDEPRLMIFDSPADGGVRMSTDEISGPALKRALLGDRGFVQPELQARLYRGLFRGREFVDAEYQRLLEGDASRRPQGEA